MSVICKVSISEIRDFGKDRLVRTQCVAENEVMAAYNPDEEDKLFSQYSPSGSADFIIDQSINIPQVLVAHSEKLYLMFVQQDNAPTFSDAICYARLSVRSATDFGGTSKQFDLSTFYNSKPQQNTDSKWLSQFSHRIMIDNPLAANQFKPSENNWWVGIYDASKHTMHEVIADAHSE